MQGRLKGDQTDPVNKFWTDKGHPRVEDDCSDRLVEMLREYLTPYKIIVQMQADMPNGKRADFTCQISGDVSLPVEAKGQWNSELWTAADNQLDAFYAINHASGGRGVYLVYWFGSTGKKRLKGPPDSRPKPQTPEELKAAFREGLCTVLRESVTVYVLDCTRGSKVV